MDIPCISDIKKHLSVNAAALVVILLLALATYSNSFTGEYHFDDLHQIVRNHYMRSAKSLPKFFVDPATSSYLSGREYRPLLLASYWLSFRLSAGDTWGFHLVNFALHISNTFLVFLLVRTVLLRSGREDTYIPLASAALFALHPVQTGAVTYISARSALLGSFFYLSAFLIFLRSRERKGPIGILLACSGVAIYFVGLMSKEIAVSLPFVLFMYELIFGKKYGGRWRFSPLWYVSLGIATGVFLYIKKLMQGYLAVSGKAYGTLEYLMSEAKVLLIYLRLLVFPVNLNADYNLAPTTSPDIWVVVSAGLVAMAVFLLLRLARKEPAAAFFGFWGLITLAPESSFIPITDIAVEYRLYLPVVGVFACVAVIAGRFWRVMPRRFVAGGLAAVMGLFCVLTFTRNEVWATELSLWRDAVIKSPFSARARMNLGGALVAVGRYPEAAEELKKALARPDPRSPNDYVTLFNLASCYSEMGMFEEAEKMYTEAAGKNPEHVQDSMLAYEELGEMYFEKGRYADAARVFEEVTRKLKGDPKGNFNLGVTYMMLGRYEAAAGRLEAARDFYADSYDLHIDLARSYEKTGRKSQADEQAGLAARLASDPEQAAEANELLVRLGAR